MTKKSASSAKVIKPKFENKVDTEEQFEKFIGVEKLKMEAALLQSKRVDTWVSLREDMKKFGLSADMLGANAEIELVNKMFKEETALYEKLVEDLNGFTYEDLIAEDFVDPYAHHIMAPEDCEDLLDYFHAFLIWSTIRSWAEHLLDLRHVTLEELEKDAAE